MPPAAAVAAPGPGAPGDQQQRPGVVQTFINTLMRMGMMWYFFNMMKGGGQQAPGAGGSAAAAVGMVKPLHARGALFDVRVFLAEAPELPNLADGRLIWQQDGVGLGTTEERKFTYMYEPSEVRARRGAAGYARARLGSWRRRPARRGPRMLAQRAC